MAYTKISHNGSVNHADSRNINNMLKTYQQRIITQISRTQRLLRNQLTLIVLLGATMVVFLIPFLFIERDARTMATGVIILIGFNYNVFFQYLRKKPLVHEANKYLSELQRAKISEENPLFVQTISQYLQKLYQILFFDVRSQKLPPAFLTNVENEDYPEIEQKLIRSLNNDVALNLIVGGLYIIAAVAAMAFMPDRMIDPYTQISFLALALLFALMIMVCWHLRKHLTSWMKGFIDLRSWTILIDEIPSKQHTQESIHESALSADNLISAETVPKSSMAVVYCPYCGEQDQIPNKYCQNCGKLISL